MREPRGSFLVILMRFLVNLKIMGDRIGLKIRSQPSKMCPLVICEILPLRALCLPSAIIETKMIEYVKD